MVNGANGRGPIPPPRPPPGLDRRHPLFLVLLRVWADDILSLRSLRGEELRTTAVTRIPPRPDLTLPIQVFLRPFSYANNSAADISFRSQRVCAYPRRVDEYVSGSG